MFRTFFCAIVCVIGVFIAHVGFGLGAPQGFGGPGGPGGGPGGQQQEQRDLTKEFDKNEDGRLNKEERAAALADLKNNPQQGFGRGGRGRGGPPGGGRGGRGSRGGRGGGRGPGGPGGGPPGGGRGGAAVVNKPGRKVALTDVESYPDKPLYDTSVMRTMFIEFDGDKWEEELQALKNFGVDVGAKVTVDGKVYNDVGIRFRGNSSYFTLGAGQKRSLNLSFDWADEDQNLYGYRTLNLLNSHADASYLRLMLYSHIGSHYTAVPKTSYVHVVINGVSWGVYINEQQMNKDFVKENFGSRKGGRFKSSPTRGQTNFVVLGDKKEDYAGYEIKSKDDDASWELLINAIKTLDETPSDEIETKVDEVLSVDRALWFLAVDNVLLDMDGYYSRGSDYAMYMEPKYGRTIVLPYDSNETFRAQGGGGPPGGRGGGMFGGLFGGGGGPPGGGGPGGGPPGGGGPGGGGGGPMKLYQPGADEPPFALNIFAGIDQPKAPIVSKLLKNPVVKARYAAHVRTIYKEFIDWEKIQPTIDSYRNLIKEEIEKDTRKLSSTADFEKGIGTDPGSGHASAPGLKGWFQGRKEYLDSVAELQQSYPEIESVKPNGKSVVATLKSGTTPPDKVFLYFAEHPMAKYQKVEMKKADGESYAAKLPIDGKVYCYVEARTADKYLTTNFYPAEAESKPLSFGSKASKKSAPAKTLVKSDRTDVVINELMAANESSIKDPQGDFEDWIELANTSSKVIDLSGMYLSDSASNSRKFKFPVGTKIKPNGFLIVWADDAKAETKGLHASFKLSKSGETVYLFDTDARGNKLLDSLEFGKLETDQAFGRTQSGSTAVVKASPGKQN